MNAVRQDPDVALTRPVADPVRVGPAAGTGLSTAAAGSMVWSVTDARKAAPGDAAPAGWYYEGTGAPGMRYWDGTAWTEHATALPPPAAVAVPPAPATAAPAVAAAAEVGTAVVGAALVGTAVANPAVATPAVATPAGQAPAVATPAVVARPRRAHRRPPVLLTWWVWLLVAGVAVCGAIAWQEARDADVVTSPSTVISPPTTTGDDTPPQATYFR